MCVFDVEAVSALSMLFVFDVLVVLFILLNAEKVSFVWLFGLGLIWLICFILGFGE